MFRRAPVLAGRSRSKAGLFDQDAVESASMSAAVALSPVPAAHSADSATVPAPGDPDRALQGHRGPDQGHRGEGHRGHGFRDSGRSDELQGRHALLEVIRVDDEVALLGMRSKTIYVNSCGPITIDSVLLPPGQQLSFLGTDTGEPRWSARNSAEVSEAVDGWIEMLWQSLCDHQPVSGSTLETWIGFHDVVMPANYQLRVEIELNEWTGFNRFCSEFATAVADKTADAKVG